MFASLQNKRLLLILAALLTSAPRPAQALEWLGHTKQLQADLVHVNPQKRIAALSALASKGSKGTEAAILRRMEHDINPDVQRHAARLAARRRLVRAVPILQKWFTHWNSRQRALAAECLEEIGAESAVDGLVRALDDPEQKVRSAIVHALSRLTTPDKREVPPLVARLKDTNSTVRRQVAEALALKRDRRTVIPLTALLNDASGDVRQTACKALGKVGDPAAGPALIRALRDRTSKVRLAAVEALQDLRAPAAIEPLIDLMKGGVHPDNERAAEALASLGGPLAMKALVKALGNRSVSAAAEQALVKAATEAAPLLVRQLEDPHTPHLVTLAAVRVARDARLAAAVPALVNELTTGRLPRTQVIQALGAIGHPSALRPLLEHLEPGNVELLLAVLDALKPVVDARATSLLVPLLQHRTASVRLGVARLLGNIEAEQAVPKLLELANEDDEPQVVRVALRAVARIGGPNAGAGLVKLLASSRRNVRRLAAGILARLRARDTADSVLALCRRSSGGVKVSAIQALGGVLRGSFRADATKFLLQTVASHDRAAQLAAVHALGALRSPAVTRGLLSLYPTLGADLRHAVVNVVANSGPGDGKVVGFLVRQLSTADPAIRAAAAWSLGKLGSAVPATPLRTALRDDDWRVRVNATAALVRNGLTDDSLKNLMTERLGYVRANAVLGLAPANKSATFARLIQKIRFDRNPWVRLNVLRGAKIHKIQEIILDTTEVYPSWSALVKAVSAQDPDNRVRAVAGELLRDEQGRGPGWIGLFPLDQDRQPLRKKDIILITPSGLVKAARTDASGELWEEGLTPGRCHLEAPTLDLFAPPVPR